MVLLLYMIILDFVGPSFCIVNMRLFSAFTKFAKLSQNKMSLNIVAIRSDHGGKIQNYLFEDYCNKYGIKHNFSDPRTLQQNDVVERKTKF